jgi:ABC-type phosphate transport system substrate-binding protein
MSSRILKFTPARAVALAATVGVLGSLITAASSYAAAGTPVAGANCQAQDGKISGRGATLQTWAQFDLIGAYQSDVCGNDAASTNTAYPAGQTNQPQDPTDPSTPVLTLNSTGGLNPVTYGGNWMIAYNYPTAQISSSTGSGQGRNAISCRTDAYAGTDTPYATADFNNINGTSGQEAGTAASCTLTGTLAGSSPTITATNTPPFTPTAQTYFTTDPQPGVNAGVMSFPVAVSAIGVAINFGGTAGCPAVGTVLNLTSTDMSGIWGGTDTNWNQLSDQPTLSTCNLSIVRVVRQDNSGTTQGFLNYLNDESSGAATCANTMTGQGNAVDTFASLDFAQVSKGRNKVWPDNASGGVTTCSPDINSGTAGGPTLIGLLEGVQTGVTGEPPGCAGCVGYADYSDLFHDPNAGSGITIENVVNASGTAEPPDVAASPVNASNCTSAGATLPTTGSNPAVGLAGQWALNFGGSTTINAHDDIAFSHQGASDYPICTMTWDFVWSHEDGNAGTPQGTGGEEGYLTADQRRTLYSYFTYLLSDAAQGTLSGAGYAPLPETFLTKERQLFQQNF